MPHLTALRILAQSSGISEDDEGQNNNILTQQVREAWRCSGQREVGHAERVCTYQRGESRTDHSVDSREPIR